MNCVSKTTAGQAWLVLPHEIMTTWDDVTTKKGKFQCWESITTPTRRNHYESCYRLLHYAHLETRATDESITRPFRILLRDGHEPICIHKTCLGTFFITPATSVPEKDGKHCQLDRCRVQRSTP